MKHVVIGTAGHIDHGKTALIRALTGRETDTLKEEKERGISINLGFTFFDLPSGKKAGIIDVPGHEKFIKNMLAGVSGIDLVLMVIAADEGVMPQTREHFEILQLLNVSKGIIVVTKIDLVDEEWLDMVIEDIKREFKGTFLENAPICKVSSKTKIGLDPLAKEIDRLTEDVSCKDVRGHFRLPVDRVFSISGFGTVVTGTVISGSIREGEQIQIYPSQILSKVRGIQINDKQVKKAEAGERCGINLANVKTSSIDRGDVISIENLMEPSLMIDCKLHYLKSALKPLKNRQRVRIYHGTSEIICRVVILDKKEVNPGEDSYVQFRLEKQLTSQRKDRFVIRSYSPMSTIGGGIIIEPSAKKAKRFNEEYIEELRIKEKGNTQNILEGVIKNLSESYPKEEDILKALGKNEASIKDQLKRLVDNGTIVILNGGEKTVYLHKDFLNEKINVLEDILEKFHENNPLKIGISKEEIKNKVFGKKIKQKIYDCIMEFLENENVIKTYKNFVSLIDFQPKYNDMQNAIRKNILSEFKKQKFIPPKYSDLESMCKDKKSFKMVFESLVDREDIVKVSENFWLLSEYYQKAKDIVINFIKEHGSISVAEFRDELQTSRKYALALMEHFDTIKFTKRMEDKRILY